MEEEKAPVWAERLMSRLDELEKKLEEKREEKPLFAALRAELDLNAEIQGQPTKGEKKPVDDRFRALLNDLELSK
ncbi:hypothetical protein [Petrimonas mucosa]|jgi:hypothetical protein|uniref:Uncharacterized protein n=1 Tax=Petrimonas mucosa TaxID=1642646 RepID=A0A1G4GAF3_9BACT|nr:hypothetical protein [Petrimonas mucosa]SCM59530.1 hypothetical protein ING2E5A_2735 [Petrimonas mucosa]